jgi:hypothetical protein
MQTDIKAADWFRELLAVFIVAVATALMIFYYIEVQPPLTFRSGTGWDGAFYMQMAEQFVNGESIMSGKPFVFRIGTPALAALVTSLDWVDSVYQGFVVVNTVFSFLNTMLVYWLIAILTNRIFGIAGGLLYILHWSSAPRFVVFAPIGTDQGSLFFLYISLIALLVLRSRPRSLLAVLSITVGLGIMFRETVLIALVILLLDRMDLQKAKAVIQEGAWRAFLGPLLSLWPPFLAALLAVLFVRMTVSIDPDHGMTTYTFARSALLHFWINSPQFFVYAMLTSFGLALVFPLLRYREVWQYLKSEPVVSYALALLVIAAYIGGLDIERYLNWGFPIYLVIIIKAFEAEKPSLPVLIGVILFYIIFSCRFLWIIPNYSADITSPEPVFAFLSDKIALFDLYVIHSEKRLTGHAFYQLVFALNLLALLMRRRYVVAKLKPMFGLKDRNK